MITRFVSVLLSVLFLSSPAWAHEGKSEHLTISHPWSRATASSQKAGAVFMTITTNGKNEDRLIGAQSPDAEAAQIHGHTMVNDVMRMRPVDGVAIPADGEAVLEPGGFHIMLIGLKAPLFEETVIPLTLVFEKAGKVEIEAVIEAAGARQPSGGTKPVSGGNQDSQPGGHGTHNR
jgi:copper(I)-binding protein